VLGPLFRNQQPNYPCIQQLHELLLYIILIVYVNVLKIEQPNFLFILHTFYPGFNFMRIKTVNTASSMKGVCSSIERPLKSSHASYYVLHYILNKKTLVHKDPYLIKFYLRRESSELHLKLRKTPQMQPPTDFQKGRLLSHRRIAGNIERKQLLSLFVNPSKCTERVEQSWDCSQPCHSLRST